MNPSVYVSRDTLYGAIYETEKLAEWLEEYMFAARYNQAKYI